MLAIEHDVSIHVAFERDGIAPQLGEEDAGKIMDLTDAAGMADLARGLKGFFHQAASLIGIAQQPNDMREIIQRRCQGVMTPPASERSVSHRIVKFEHGLQLLSGLAEFTGLEGSNPGHAVQDETTCWIAFVGKPGARALGNQCGSAIVTASDGTYVCSMRCDEQLCVSPRRLPSS